MSAVSQAQSKWDAIEALLANHQMGRVGRIYSLIEAIEDKFLHPDGTYAAVLNASPEFALEVLKVLTKEGAVITDYVEKKKFGSVDPSIVDPSSRRKGCDLDERAKALPAPDRALITQAVKKLRARGEASRVTVPKVL